MNGYRPDDRHQITEVWADNLEEEFHRIRDVVEHFQYVAMDTEFPGIVARPTGNVTEYNYQTVKCNVDLLKVIQLGVTFADSHGNLAFGTSTWQFNFRFDLDRDMYAQDSIDFLKQSGIDFEKQQRLGIDLHDFGELIMSSGLVMNEDVKWISFHGCYDFGYLLKLLTCAPLPHSEAQFFELLHDFFPALYDIKYLLRNIRNLNINGGSSLQKIAEHLNVERVGRQHQAGSDSLVTCRTFFKLMETYFDNQIDDSKFSGVIYGLGAASVPQHSRLNSENNVGSPSPTLVGPQPSPLSSFHPVPSMNSSMVSSALVDSFNISVHPSNDQPQQQQQQHNGFVPGTGELSDSAVVRSASMGLSGVSTAVNASMPQTHGQPSAGGSSLASGISVPPSGQQPSYGSVRGGVAQVEITASVEEHVSEPHRSTGMESSWMSSDRLGSRGLLRGDGNGKSGGYMVHSGGEEALRGEFFYG